MDRSWGLQWVYRWNLPLRPVGPGATQEQRPSILWVGFARIPVVVDEQPDIVGIHTQPFEESVRQQVLIGVLGVHFDGEIAEAQSDGMGVRVDAQHPPVFTAKGPEFAIEPAQVGVVDVVARGAWGRGWKSPTTRSVLRSISKMRPVSRSLAT